MRPRYTNTWRTKLNPIQMNTPASPLHYPKDPRIPNQKTSQLHRASRHADSKQPTARTTKTPQNETKKTIKPTATYESCP